MRIIKLTCVGVVALAALAGCEKRARTRNSSGSSALFEENAAQTTNVYRFVGAEQSLTDARDAIKAESWLDAQAATEALLKQQPGNAEAKAILAQARLEAPNQILFNQLNKAASAGELGVAVRAYRQIAETSVYRERGLPVFEKVGAAYVEAMLADTRNHNRNGRCDDARRVVRVTSELFPDARDGLEQAAAGCRPAKHELLIEVAKMTDKPDDKPGTAIGDAPMASAPLAMSAEAPKTSLSDATPPPIPPPAARPLAAERTFAATVPAAAPTNPTRMAPPPSPPPAPAPAPIPAPVLKPRNIPGAELETLRIAGDKNPSLPAGAKMIARRDKVGTITFAVKLCLSADGVPTSVNYVKSSDYADANEKVLSDIRKWRFRPYIYNGAAVPVCSATLLQYQII